MQFGLNILLALVWAFLHTSYTLIDFSVGYVLGALIIWLVGSVIGRQKFYLRRFFKAVKLALIFFRELFIACMQVLYHVLQPRLKIRPGIIRMEIYLKTPAEITLLANMITLTPGTMTVEVAADHSALYIHTLHISDADEVCAGIERTFERNIWEVFHG